MICRSQTITEAEAADELMYLTDGGSVAGGGLMFARRKFIGGAALALILQGCETLMEEIDATQPLYGLIGQMIAAPGKRDELVGYLQAGTQGMPGNLVYLIAKDAGDPESIWITEVWVDQASHQASLALPAVQEAIARARPILAGFGTRVETIPLWNPV